MRTLSLGPTPALYVEHPSFRLTTFYLFFRCGPVVERPEELGIAHLLEHAALNSSARTSGRVLKGKIEQLGGSFDAETESDFTVFWCRFLNDQFLDGLDPFLEMILDPALDAEEIENEKKVVREEMTMVRDDPKEWSLVRFREAFFRGTPWARDPLGRAETLKRLGPGDLRRFHRRHYTAANAVVAWAGGVPKKPILERLDRWWGGRRRGSPRRLPHADAGRHPAPRVRERRGAGQCYFVVGWPTPGDGEPARAARSWLLSTVLGGGEASRLFRALREERGLAYEVSAEHVAAPRAGALAASSGVAARNLPEALDLVRREALRLPETLGEEDVERARHQALTWLEETFENPRQEMYWAAVDRVRGQSGYTRALAAEVRRMRSGTLRRAAGEVFRGPETLSVVGPSFGNRRERGRT